MKKLTHREGEALASLARVKDRLYPNYYSGTGRFSKKSADHALFLKNLLLRLGFVEGKHFETGNDSPRGGWSGEFVSLLPAGRRRKIIKDQTETKTK